MRIIIAHVLLFFFFFLHLTDLYSLQVSKHNFHNQINVMCPKHTHTHTLSHTHSLTHTHPCRRSTSASPRHPVSQTTGRAMLPHRAEGKPGVSLQLQPLPDPSRFGVHVQSHAPNSMEETGDLTRRFLHNRSTLYNTCFYKSHS